MKEYYVYMLRCSDGSYYVGVTNNLNRRLEEHESGHNEGCYTYERRPLTLVYSLAFPYVLDAIHYEKVLKAWSRKKKEALIAGDEELIRLLSKKKFPIRCKRQTASRRRFNVLQRRFLVRSRLRRELLGMTSD